MRRYGVVSKSLLARESIAVAWRDVLRELRFLEAWGEIRGSWFVAALIGEQYALPDTVQILRRVRHAPTVGVFVTMRVTDPVTRAGIGRLVDRVPAMAFTRIAFGDGVPIGTLTGTRKLDWTDQQTPEQEWDARNALLRRRIPALSAWSG